MLILTLFLLKRVRLVSLDKTVSIVVTIHAKVAIPSTVYVILDATQVGKESTAMKVWFCFSSSNLKTLAIFVNTCCFSTSFFPFVKDLFTRPSYSHKLQTRNSFYTFSNEGSYSFLKTFNNVIA